MLTLHLSDYQDRFAIWAETATGRGDAGADYPYQADYDQLLAALAAIGFQRPAELPVETVWIWTPALDGRVLLPGQVGMGEGLSLAPRELRVLLPEPAQVLEWLLSPIMPEAPREGSELAVWRALLQLAASLLARRRLLPGLSPISDFGAEGWQAHWQPLPEAEDHVQLGKLARALPGSARALTPLHDEAPRRRALDLLSAALGRLCDALVRRRPLGAEPGSLAEADLSLPERWLQALRKRQGALKAPEADLLRLSRQLETWSGPLRRRTASPFQLVFQLEEPSETSEGWYLRALLRPLEDPSLYLPLDYVWAPMNQQPEVLRIAGSQARDFVVLALNEAATLCPALQPLAASRLPQGQELDLGGVRALLEAAEALEAAGYGLRLPAWWLRGRQRLKAKVRISPPAFQAGGGLSLDSVLEADWKLMLGDVSLTLEELRELAGFKSDLVQWQGQWLLVEPQTLQAARRFFAQRGERMQLQDVLSLMPDEEQGGFELEEIESEDWLKDVLERLHSGTPPEIEAPPGFVGTLRPYQQRGLSWLAFLCSHGLGACLADDMGLGKTIQTLALILHLKQSQGLAEPVLLVCPTSLLNNWLWEAEHFTPDLKVLIHHGTGRAKGEALDRALAGHDLIVTSYSLLARDKDALLAKQWTGVILDEAQNIKNPETQQTRVARALPARWRIALTGTPVENHVGDLWSVMDFLNPRLLGSRQSFQTQFLTPIQRWQDKEALERLRRLVAPFLLRRLKSDRSIVAELPDKLEMKVHCTLTREQASLYLAVLRDLEAALARAVGIERRGLILAALTRLKQVCNHPAQYLGESSRLGGRSGKLMRLKEMVEEILEVGEKSLIFTQYAEMGKLLQQYLGESFDQEVLLLHGGTPAKARPDLIKAFQEDERKRLFVLSLKAGGTGLNLTAASHVFHFDRWWNPAVENQATDRAYRIGQTRQVQVHTFVCSGTLEERIDQLLETKRAIAGQIVAGGEHWLTELSDAELHDLFALDLARVER